MALFDPPADRMLVLTPRGGHCTFYEGLLWPRADLGWADRLALEYLAAVLALRAEGAPLAGTPKGADVAPAAVGAAK